MRWAAVLLLLASAHGYGAAVVVDDDLVGTLCADGLVYLDGCPSATPVEGFHVKSGGCTTYNVNTCNGTSDAQAFGNLGMLTARAAANCAPLPGGTCTGVDIWVKAGFSHSSLSSGRLSTLWAGSSSDPAIWGCYYDDVGAVTRACWEGSSGSDLDVLTGLQDKTTIGLGIVMPHLYGKLTDACMDNTDCNWAFGYDGENTDCTSAHQALLNIIHPYVHFMGFNISRSGCRGVTLNPSLGSGGRILFKNNVVQKNGFQTVVVQGGSNYSVLKRNLFTEGVKCSLSKVLGGTNAEDTLRAINPDWTDTERRAIGANCARGEGHSGGVVTSGVGDAFVGYNDNTLVRSFSEGFQCFSGSTKVWVKGNRAGNTPFSAMYMDACSDSLVESNILWATKGDVGQPSGRSYNFGENPMRVIVEDSQASPTQGHSERITARNNLFVNMSEPIKMARQQAAAAAGKRVGARYFHNTIIGATRNWISNAANMNTTGLTEANFRNNIFASSTAPPSASNCLADPDATYNNNLFQTAIVAGCKGNADINGSNPITAGLALDPFGSTANLATWTAKTWSNMPDADDARTSLNTHTGFRLNNVECITSADQTGFAEIAPLMDQPFSVDRNGDGTISTGTGSEMAIVGACAATDFWGNLRGDQPDVGLHENGGAN